MGAYALQTACAQIGRWTRQGVRGVVVSVNVSAQQLQDPAFVELVATTLRGENVAPHQLELELTESSVIGALEQVTANLRAFRQLGFFRALGCRLAQGYYFSRPLPAAQLTPFLQMLPAARGQAELARSVN